jgi:fumarate reductase subunit D
MLVSEATWLVFAAFSCLRTISYVPQIVCIAKDRNGASAISYPTWLLWTGAHASTGLYAAMNLNDVWLAVASSIYALCCIVVIVLTAFKRLAHRRTKDMSPRSDANYQAWGGRLRAA